MHRKSQTCEFPAKTSVILGWKFGLAKYWKYCQHPNKKILQIKFHVHDTSYLQEIITCHSPCDVYLPVQAQEQVYSNIVLEVSVLILVWRQLLQALFSQLDLVHCAGKWYKLAIALFTSSFHCIACIITCKLCGCHNWIHIHLTNITLWCVIFKLLLGSISVSGQLPTYPSPNPTLTLTCYQLTDNKLSDTDINPTSLCSTDPSSLCSTGVISQKKKWTKILQFKSYFFFALHLQAQGTNLEHFYSPHTNIILKLA